MTELTIRPDWNEIASKIGDDLSPSELHSAWFEQCNKWLEAVSEAYGGNYHIHHSENFSLLSNESDRYVELFSSFLERSRQRILTTLHGIASDEGYGNHVALVFSDIDQYYDYVHMFYPDEGEFGLSSGMYINEGYGHFVFPTRDISEAEPIAVHELTHACLSHLPIPLWLNEGLAVLMEDVLAGKHLYLDKEIVGRHQNYWNEKTIQNFWSGESFFAIDEGQELSYNLAHILVRNIARDYDSFITFANNANADNAGEEASLKYLGLSLCNVATSFLGEGNWKPKEDLMGSIALHSQC